MYKVSFTNRPEQSYSAENLKDLKRKVIAEYGSTKDVTLVRKFDLKHRHYFVVESTRGNQKNKKSCRKKLMEP